VVNVANKILCNLQCIPELTGNIQKHLLVMKA